MLHNDEGMWLPNHLPLERLKKLYDFTPTQKWIEHVQKASVRMNNGGSASLISPKGLLITNHHVAESVLHEMSSREKDYVKDGFYAHGQKDERQVPQLEVNVLWEIEDVTERVEASAKPGMTPEKSFAARRAEITKVEEESFKKTGLRSNVVTLYQGGQYHLYRFKKYTDVRLVFAPEYAIAGFGGDFDNYEYPRYCLDVSFFRVYENGQPLRTEHYFKWNFENPKEKRLSFVSGHPGSTDRLSTLARILYLRDHGLPYWLETLYREEVVLQQFSGRSEENKRKAHHALHGVQNARKLFVGQLAALQNPHFIARKKEQEDVFRKKVSVNPRLHKAYSQAWEMVERIEKRLLEIRDKVNFFDGAMGFNTKFFWIARTIVRMAEEDKKPNEKRLPEFIDSARDSLLEWLFSPAPIYPDLEEWTLAESLAFLAETFGFEDSAVKNILAGKSPRARARELIARTKLDDAGERRRLVRAGKNGVRKSTDSFIRLAFLIDKDARHWRRVFENEVEELLRRAYAKIARAQFEIYGRNLYPDATFTLRIAFGRVLGYTEKTGVVKPFTAIGEIFAHAQKHGGKDPWALPASWIKNKNVIAKSKKAFNFISTHDTHGGNSGSPVFTHDLKIAGILFDGTVAGLGDTFLYSDEESRSVSVSTAGISEVLEKIYHTKRLLEELGM